MSKTSFKDLPTDADIAYNATTLSGYGITDTYTKEEIERLIPGKIPIASPVQLGGVKINGNNLAIAADGTLSADSYKLQVASSTVLGGVKINGNNLAIAADGTLSASTGGLQKEDLEFGYDRYQNKIYLNACYSEVGSVNMTQAISSDLKYKYQQTRGNALIAIDGYAYRLHGSQLTANVTVTLPIPSDNNTADCMLRFSEGTTLYSINLQLDSSVMMSKYNITGDDIEDQASYEQFILIMPNGIDSATSKKKYEVTITTRKMNAI